jgi:hypothetical protein
MDAPPWLSFPIESKEILFDPLRMEGGIALDDFQLSSLPFSFGKYQPIRLEASELFLFGRV